MKPKITKYLLAIWFSVLLLIGNTPMDFIHLFADHKDTVHHEHKGMVAEKAHHHCAFLSLSLTSFVNDYYVPVVLFTPAEYHTTHTSILEDHIQRYIIVISQRGPPTV